VRWALAALFAVFNFPWVIVVLRMFSGSLWGIGRISYIAPWIAWQIMGGVSAALSVSTCLAKACAVRGTRCAGNGARIPAQPLTAHHTPVSRRQFLARATYAYAARALGSRPTEFGAQTGSRW